MITKHIKVMTVQIFMSPIKKMKISSNPNILQKLFLLTINAKKYPGQIFQFTIKKTVMVSWLADIWLFRNKFNKLFAISEIV